MLLYLIITLSLTSLITTRLRNLNEETVQVQDTDYDPKELITNYTTDIGKYFLHFAAYGYCTLEEMEQKTCCQTIFEEDGWELLASGKIDYDNYNFAILVHHEFKKVIITFPGTRSKLQLFFEILNHYATPFSESDYERVNGYFNVMYQKIKDLVDEPLKKIYLEHRDYQFIFTGHSLGASMAAILALDSVKYGHLKKSEHSPVLINYGMPRTGNDVFANEVMKHIAHVYRVTRQGDLVASIPLCYHSGYLDLSCQTFLPEGKFVEDLELTQEQKDLEKTNFYGWHVGGLKLYNYDMDDYVDCGDDVGENFKDQRCLISKSINIFRHTYYFGVHVHRLCSLT